MLNRAKENYEQGIKYDKYKLRNEFIQFKQSIDFLKEVSAYAIYCSAIEKLDRAFKNFFAKRSRYPKFRSKKHGVGSFHLDGSRVKYNAVNKCVYIQRIGWIKLAEQVRFDYSKLYRITVSNRAGQWYCSFTLEVEDNRVCENQADVIGFDLGVSNMATGSDGTAIDNPKLSKRYAIRLRQLNKELSRKTKGGKNWWKTVFKLRRLHKRIADIRLDYIHKFTSSVCKKYGVVCLENLNVSGMVRNRKLAKAISDVSFAEIRRQFQYKAFETRFCDRFETTTNRCSVCHNINQTKLPLNDRVFVCECCGYFDDRDFNAARNIKHFAVSSTGNKKPIAKIPMFKDDFDFE
jgi:putative transposase